MSFFNHWHKNMILRIYFQLKFLNVLKVNYFISIFHNNSTVAWWQFNFWKWWCPKKFVRHFFCCFFFFKFAQTVTIIIIYGLMFASGEEGIPTYFLKCYRQFCWFSLSYTHSLNMSQYVDKAQLKMF